MATFHPWLSKKLFWLATLAASTAGAAAFALGTALVTRDLARGELAASVGTVGAALGLAGCALLCVAAVHLTMGGLGLAFGWLRVEDGGLTVVRFLGLVRRHVAWKDLLHVEFRPTLHRGVQYGTRVVVSSAEGALLDADSLYDMEALHALAAAARARGVAVSGTPEGLPGFEVGAPVKDQEKERPSEPWRFSPPPAGAVLELDDSAGASVLSPASAAEHPHGVNALMIGGVFLLVPFAVWLDAYEAAVRTGRWGDALARGAGAFAVALALGALLAWGIAKISERVESVRAEPDGSLTLTTVRALWFRRRYRRRAPRVAASLGERSAPPFHYLRVNGADVALLLGRPDAAWLVAELQAWAERNR